MENQQPQLLDNPLIVQYFEDHFFGSDTAVSYAASIIGKYFPRRNIYHNGPNHVWKMLQDMSIDEMKEGEQLTKEMLENQFVGFFFALFHDCIPDSIPACREQLSLECRMKTQDDRYIRLFQMVHDAIQASMYYFEDISLLPPHVQYCIRHDTAALYDTDTDKIEAQERLMFKEYQKVDFDFYRQKRKEVLSNIYRICKIPQEAMQARFEWLDNWKPKIGIFAGTFHPFTAGHMDILKQAERNFDKVIIAVGNNGEKWWNSNQDFKFHHEDLAKRLKFHQVDVYNGMLANYLKSKPYDVTLIRGLRNGNDLQYEQNVRAALIDGYPQAKIVYYLCNPQLAHISSSLCRDVVRFDQKLYMQYTNLGDYERDY